MRLRIPQAASGQTSAWSWTQSPPVLWAVVAPYWLVVLVLAILPCGWLVRNQRRMHHRRRGLCEVCGYDVRATPQRCPECGAPPVNQRF